jgi:hypothetical protein
VGCGDKLRLLDQAILQGDRAEEQMGGKIGVSSVFGGKNWCQFSFRGEKLVSVQFSAPEIC